MSFLVTLEHEALAAATRLAAETPAYQGRPLRLYLEGKGCDGFFYGVAFDERHVGDHVLPQTNGIDLVVDSETAIFVEGASIAWVDDERGRGFLVNNPNQRKFRGKFYKRSAWRDRLLARQADRQPGGKG